jgi:hypothetical protein
LIIPKPSEDNENDRNTTDLLHIIRKAKKIGINGQLGLNLIINTYNDIRAGWSVSILTETNRYKHQHITLYKLSNTLKYLCGHGFVQRGSRDISDIPETLFTTFYKNELAMRNTVDMTGGKPIAVLLQSLSGVSAINPLVAFYDRHKKDDERERCYSFILSRTPHETTRDTFRSRYVPNTLAYRYSLSDHKSIACHIASHGITALIHTYHSRFIPQRVTEEIFQHSCCDYYFNFTFLMVRLFINFNNFINVA